MSATQVLDPHTQWGHHHHHHGSGGAPYYGGPTDAYHHQAYHGEAQYHNEYDYDYGPHPSQQQPPLPPQQQQHPEPQEHQHQEPSPQDEYTQGDPQQGYYYDGYPQEDCYAQPPPPPPPQQASQPHSNAKQQAVVPTVRELAESVGVEDPAATETEAWRTHVVEVACRLRGSDYYWYNDAVAQQTRVLVSADRGHDLGVVIGCWDAETAQRLNKIPPTNLIKRGHFFVMLRPVPTAVAKEKLLKQASQEQKAVEEANRIVSTLDLSSQIAIKDAVFQHDGRKLTLFYTTDSAYYKHYGPLLQPLWNVFRCRIWLHRLANKEEEPAETNDAADEF
eukprot:Rhum_TRINITY_DN15212_c10_g2::Rhum_TRINITY_DN15212_c10_g2_i1::g.144881::m.144881